MEKRKWFNEIADSLRDYSDGDIWSDGEQLLCKSESAANAIADMLWCLYAAQEENVVVVTGYYDPDEDRKNNAEDRYTGWWYISLD